MRFDPKHAIIEAGKTSGGVMTNKIKKYAPFFIAALIGSGFLAKRLRKEVPKMMGRIMPRMMEGMMGEGGNPMDMCRRMMEGFGKVQEMAAYATPEMQALFEEWVQRMEASVLEFVKEKGTANPQDIAAHLEISAESAVFLVSKLVRKGKLKIGSVEANRSCGG